MQESLGVICERSCIEGFWGTVPPSLMMSLLFKAQLKPRDSSVEVRSDWEVKEEMDFPRLMKMRYMEVADPLDMWVKHTCCVSSVVNQGETQKVTSICVLFPAVSAAELWSTTIKPSTGSPPATRSSSKASRGSSTPSRPLTTPSSARSCTRRAKHIRNGQKCVWVFLCINGYFVLFLQLAKTQGNVFATDAILATLMCCTRSVNSWDIIVQRVGNKLFFDKRDNSDFGESLNLSYVVVSTFLRWLNFLYHALLHVTSLLCSSNICNGSSQIC